MPLQPTASKAALLLQCPRPFEEGVDIEREPPSEAAAYGTRFHKRLAALIEGGATAEVDVTYQAEDEYEFVAHLDSALMALRTWMQPDGNPWGLEFHVAAVEVSAGISFPYSHVPATLHDPDGAHEYRSDDSADVYGTADLILQASSGHHPGMRVVVDHKTGVDFAGSFMIPSAVRQMQVLGLMFDADAVAILHSPPGAPAVVYSEEFNGRQALREQFHAAVERIGSGFLRVGPECKYCPARGSCPAKQGELLASTGAMVKALTGFGGMSERIDPGRFHLMLTDLKRLEGMARAELRQRVREGEVITRPDGKTLEISRVDVERMPAKEKIIAWLGHEAAEKLFEEWRVAGIMGVVEEERLVAK